MSWRLRARAFSQCAAEALRVNCRATSLFSAYSPHQSLPNVIGQAPTPFSRRGGGKRRQYPTACSESGSAPSVGWKCHHRQPEQTYLAFTAIARTPFRSISTFNHYLCVLLNSPEQGGIFCFNAL